MLAGQVPIFRVFTAHRVRVTGLTVEALLEFIARTVPVESLGKYFNVTETLVCVCSNSGISISTWQTLR
jgi:hypothetical protein